MDSETFTAFALAGGSLVLAIGLSTAIAMPFHGAMIRLRANYNPKAVDLEGKGNRVGPVLTSIFGTMRRTKRLEGWYGLYKGAYPSFGFSILTLVCSMITMELFSAWDEQAPEDASRWGGFPVLFLGTMTVLLTILGLPMSVITNRCIVTPYRLPSHPLRALRLILSPRELSAPWVVYTTPGLLLTTFLTTFSLTLVPQTARIILLGPKGQWAEAVWWQWAVLVIWQAVGAAWLTPLYVVGTRLSIQKNMGGGFVGLGGGEEGGEGEVVEGVELCGEGEDVIALRPDNDPYLGMLDCERRMVDEEGWGSLYRGWAWTALGNVISLGN